MKSKVSIIAAGILLSLALFVTPVLSHHSFAMYD